MINELTMFILLTSRYSLPHQ